MRTGWAVLAALSLAASSSTFEEPELPGHHGYRHVEGETAGHRHGDADDHHESPDSPCHHHETQICPGHAPELAVSQQISIIEPGLERLFRLVTIEPSDTPAVQRIFHIPIA